TGLSLVRPKQTMSAKKPRNTPSGAEALCKLASIQGSEDPCSLRYEQITGRQHKCEQALACDGFLFDVMRWDRSHLQSLCLFFPESLERSVDKPAQVPAVDKLVWRFAGCVMAARQHVGLEVEADAAECIHHFQRVLPGKREVVIGIDHQHSLPRPAGFGAGEFFVKVARA